MPTMTRYCLWYQAVATWTNYFAIVIVVAAALAVVAAVAPARAPGTVPANNTNGGKEKTNM